jgi:hypothetical protein
MPLRIGTLTPSKLYLGSTEVTKAYLGAVEVYSSSPAPAWTPADLGANLALWLDADDADTITLNGSTVAQWSDKSGGGRHVTMPTAANQPTYAATGLNGRPALLFETNAKFLARPDGNPTLGTTDLSAIDAGDTFAVFAVGDGGDGNSQYQAAGGRAGVMVGKGGGIANAGTFVLGLATHDGSNNALDPPRWFGQFNGYAGTGVQNNPNWNAGTLSTPAVVGVVWDGTTVTGTLDGTTWANAGPIGTAANQNSAFRIGGMGTSVAGNSTTGGGNSKASEVVICDAALTAADRQKLEGYLAWKWGLEANLPADHPYKTNPPTVAP